MSVDIQREMYNRVIELIEKRYPIGWGGAGVIYTEKGNYFTSVALESSNASVLLCIETGAMCEAHKFNEKVIYCLCVVRDDEKSSYKILSPCGVCQERLRYWGDDVKVGVTNKENEILFVSLKELQPYHWTNAYNCNEISQFKN